MDRVLLVLGGVAIAGFVAALLGRSTAAPAANTHHIPRHLDRNDFARPDAPWLVGVFSSATCDTCQGVWERARHLESDQVAVVEVEVGAEKALHDRYKIDAVPTVVICDATGEVKRAFLGPTTATDLWAAVAEVREPGSVPPGCHTGEI
jgi:hypothetical protein